jgi:type I restriction enzyme, S subunit
MTAAVAPIETEAATLPEGWKSVQLRDEHLFAFENGIWTSKKEPFVNCAVVRNTNFSDDGRLDLTDVAYIDIESRQLSRKKLAWGDIIIERSGGGPKQPVGRVAFFDLHEGNFCFSNFTSRLRIVDRDAVDPEYIHAFLFFFHISGQTEPLQRRTTGIRNLSFEEYKATFIPLPPLAEQRAVASTLRAAQVAAQARRRLAELERERKAALMQALFTRGTRGDGATRQTLFGEVPAHWPALPLEECAFVQTGVAKGRNLKGKQTVELPYLRVANVQDGHLDLTEIKTIQLLASEVERYRLRDGDVVVTEGGDFDKLGRGFIWRDEVPGCVHQNHIFAIRPAVEQLSSEFLTYLIQSRYGKAYFLSVAHRTTNLASINSTKLKALPVLIPPLAEQRELSEALRACDAVVAGLEREAALHEELFRALLEELMTGRVRVGER